MRGLPFFRHLLLAVFAVPLLAQADVRYAVTVVGGANSRAFDLNNAGQVVGSLDAGGASHAFLYSGGTAIDLGTLGGASSIAAHINDHGQVVGTSETSDSNRGFIYSGGVMSAIPGTGWSSASGINNAGAVVGTQAVDAGDGFVNPHGYVYANGVVKDLGTLPIGDFSQAVAINSAGRIVGAAANMFNGAPNYPTTSFIYCSCGMKDIGNFGGVWSSATSINDAGQVVGYSGLPDAIGGDIYPTRAYLYTGGVLQNLGSLVDNRSTVAYDINNLGQIVGAGNTADRDHGFLYQNGAMVDLNALIDPASGWTISEASAINDLQQIAGTACSSAGCYAVRLDLVSAVPEPRSYAMLFGGLAVLGACRRRRRGTLPR